MPLSRLASAQHQQKLRFVLVGLANTAFGYGLFALLVIIVGSRVPYLISLLVAHVAGVLEAFILHRWLTFRVQGRVLGDLLRFWSVYLVALGVNLVLLPLLVEVGDLPVLLAQAIVLLLTALGSYVGHHRFSFRRTATEPGVPV
jgi:putative flippase GtrA